MIPQTAFDNDHIRLYGCYFLSLLSIAEDIAGKQFTKDDILTIFNRAVKSGLILDNNIPVGQDGWYRCFVTRPADLIAIGLRFLGNQNTMVEVYRGAIKQPDSLDYVIIEHATAMGSHFTRGDKELKTTFDPWAGLARKGIKTVRFWRVK